MTASAGLSLSFVLFILIHIASANIILECLSLFYCNAKQPVCGTNSTHCWHSASDCERAKFNCLQLYHKDFDKVDLSYCGNLTVGAIIPCCTQKTCPNKYEPICGQAINECKWFRNSCELENVNCASGKDFLKVNKDLCNFKFDNIERHCTHPAAAVVE